MPKPVPHTLNLLSLREEGPWGKSTFQTELQKLAEDKAASAEMQEIHCKLPSTVRSTFLMAFSPDSTKVASTHGDHKIYVCDVKTGKLLHKLEGHPRTPWCVAFHPTSNDILASGCLGGEVRVWDLHGGSEKWLAEENTVITSLTFHPFDKVLVIATYNQLHFWNWSHPRPFATCKTSSEREKVRFVKFDHLGTRLITGIANLPSDDVNHENIEVPVAGATAAPRGPRPLSSNSLRSHRRSILSRLISMYHQMEGLEELSRYQEPYPRPESPTEEEAISQAREYATTTTRLAFLQRHMRLEQALFGRSGGASVSLSLPPEYSHLQDELENPDLSDTNDSYASRYFWTTFQRLRLICTSLERRLPRQIRSLEQHTDENENPTNSAAEQESNSDTPGNDNEVRHSAQHRASVSLINLLNRLQHSLRSAMLSTTYAQEQIEQVQRRISELLERLTSVTGYRARLSNLRDQIYDVADRAMRRGHETSPGQRWDLAHCLWLVEMSLELTRQMQRILQADFRLTHLHLSSPSSEISGGSTLETSSSDSSSRSSDVNSFTQTAMSVSTHSDQDINVNQNSEYSLADESVSSSFLNENNDSSAENVMTGLSSRSNVNSNSLDNPEASDENRTQGPDLSELRSCTENVLNAFTARTCSDGNASETDMASNENISSDSHFTDVTSSSVHGTRGSLTPHLCSGNSSPQNSEFASSENGTVESSADSSVSRPRSSSSRRDSGLRVRNSPASRGFRENREFLLNRRSVLRRRYRLINQISTGLDREVRSTSRRTVGQPSPWSSSIWNRSSRSLLNMPSSSGASSASRGSSDSYTGLFRHVNVSQGTSRTDDDTAGTADSQESSDVDNQDWDSNTDQQPERIWSDPSPNVYLDRSPGVPQFRIDPPPRQDEPEPLPAYDRPRSPPLSEILSSINGTGDPADPAPSSIFGRMPAYLSMMYDSGFRSRFGVQEQMPTFTHRIQSWDFSKCQMPNLSNSKCNIVVPRCKIHNDASVDISRDGEMLVALVPSSEVLAVLMLCVHSLKPDTLGQRLYSLSYETNAISVSLSPLGRYVVVGLASPRLYFSNTEKEAVAQIFKLEPGGKLSVPKHVRSLTQQGTEAYYPPVSLNSVRWLPHPGQGLIYGTNRGCLCICKPVAPMSSKKKLSRRNRTLVHTHLLSMGMAQRVRNPSPLAQQPTSSASTQTIGPQTQTTGTQTFSSEGNSRR